MYVEEVAWIAGLKVLEVADEMHVLVAAHAFRFRMRELNNKETMFAPDPQFVLVHNLNGAATGERNNEDGGDERREIVEDLRLLYYYYKNIIEWRR